MATCDMSLCSVKVCEDQLLERNEFADECVCKICLVHVVGSNPKLTKCSHLFCGDCLEHWFTSHRSNTSWAQRARSCGEVPCPACKVPLRKDADVFTVGENESGDGATLWHMIQTLNIRCATIGCHWTGSYGAYCDHLQSGSCEPRDDDGKTCSPRISSTGSPSSSPAELSADESDDHEFFLGATACEQSEDCIITSDISPMESVVVYDEEPTRSSDSQVEASPSIPDGRKECGPASDVMGQDLSSLIRQLIQVDSGSATSAAASGPICEASITEEQESADTVSESSQSSHGVTAVKERKQGRARGARKKGTKATHPVAEPSAPTTAQAAQVAQHQQLQMQAAVWQAHANSQRYIAAQQWQALAASNPHYAMASAQMAHMQQLALYQQLAMRANHNSA